MPLAKGLNFRRELALIGLSFTDEQLFNHSTEETLVWPKPPPRRSPLPRPSYSPTSPLPPSCPKASGSRLDALAAEIEKSLGNKGAGVITIPGLVKIEKKQVPARKAEKGVPNPFKPGELMDRPAKPAYNKVKVRALKLLKDMAK